MAFTRSGRLSTLEAARGLAALAVVSFHTNSAAQFIGHDLLKPLTAGEHGVDFFFVLSGFIMFFVHRGDFGQPQRARDYLMKRFIRLFPILWFVVGTCLLAKAAIGEPASLSVAGTSLFLYPSAERPYPLVLWTLRHEIVFYLAFGVLVLSRRGGLLLFAVWGSACMAQFILVALGRPIEGVGAFLLSSFQLDFFMGGLLAEAHRRRTFRPTFLPLFLGLVLVAALVTLEQTMPFHRQDPLDYVSPPAMLGTLALGFAFTVVLHGLLCIEPVVTPPNWLLELGAASYAIYLVHTPLNSLSQRLVVSLPPGFSHLIIGVVGVWGGLIVHRRLERPLTMALRGGTLLRRAASEPAR